MDRGNVDGIYCRECGQGIATGFSWQGFCVVCAQPHIEKPDLEWLTRALASGATPVLADSTKEDEPPVE